MIYGYARCSTNESKQDINRQVTTAMSDIAAILEECDTKQARVISDMVKAIKQSFDKYMNV